MTNELVLTSQELYCFMDFVSNLVVENMTKNNTFAGIKNGGDYFYFLGVD